MTGRKTLFCIALACSILLGTRSVHAQLPDGPGRDLTAKACSQCHEPARILSQHQDKKGWTAIIAKMKTLGYTGTDEDTQKIIEYLAAVLPAEAIEKLNINSMNAVQFETTLSIPRPLSRAIVDFRDKNGDFKSLDDLKKGPDLTLRKLTRRRISSPSNSGADSFPCRL